MNFSMSDPLPLKICRVCLTMGEDREYFQIKDNMRYFTELLKIEIDKLVVHWLCNICHMLVKDALTFADKVWKANQTLSNLLKQRRKNNEKIVDSIQNTRNATECSQSSVLQNVSLVVKKEIKFEAPVEIYDLHCDTIKVENCETESRKSETDNFTEEAESGPDDDNKNNFRENVELIPVEEIPVEEVFAPPDINDVSQITNKERECAEIECNKGLKLVATINVLKENSLIIYTFKCPHCDYTNTNREDVDLHFASQHMVNSKPQRDCQESQIRMQTEPNNVIDMPTNISDNDKRIIMIDLSIKDQLEEFKKRALRKSYRERLFKCELCLTAFVYKEPYMMHLQKHAESYGIYKCEICKLRSKSNNSRMAHFNNHAKMYQCSKCEFRKFSRSSVREHYNRDHIKQLYRCNECEKNFGTPALLKKHSVLHNAKRFECCHCEHLFMRKESLRNHIRRMHTVPTEGVSLIRYNCQVCGKGFQMNYALKLHMSRHSNKRDFYCVKCDVAFKTSYELRQHLKNTIKHADPKSLLPCTDCNLKFLFKPVLQRHIRVMHSGEKHFKCELCSKSYYTIYGVQRHHKSKHEGIQPARKYMCDQCGKSYMNKKTLTLHQNTHTGARPYICKLCGATFAYDASLFTHNQLVHLKKKRNCDIKKTKKKKGKSKVDTSLV